MSKPLSVPKRCTGQLTPSHIRARVQEKQLAKKLGGTTTPGSGAFDVKGDVRVSGVARIECKTTKHKSFAVTREMVTKIEAAALGAGEVPAMVIEFLTAAGKPESSVAVIPLWALESLIANFANQKQS